MIKNINEHIISECISPDEKYDISLNESLTNVFLLMNYDNKKTLSENIEIINEQGGALGKLLGRQQIKKGAGKTGLNKYLKRYKKTGFYHGWKTESTYKRLFRNLIKFNAPLTGFTTVEKKKFAWWLAFGVNRLPSDLLKMLKKNGFLYTLASLGGEVLKRWFSLTKQLTILNGLYQLVIDNSDYIEERPEEEILLNVWEIMKRAFFIPEFKWIMPALMSWKSFKIMFGPILAGKGPLGILDNIKKEIKDREIEKSKIEEKVKKMINKGEKRASVDDAKLVAQEDIKDYIWEDDSGKIYLAVGENDNFLITLENNVYMVKLPNNQKIKLSDY